MARASLFTDHKKTSLPIRANYNFSEQCLSILLTIRQQILSLLLWTDGRQYMELRLCVIVSRFVCLFAISFHTFLCMTFHVIGPRRNTKIFRGWSFLSSLRGNSWSKHGSVIVNNIFAYFTLSLSTSQIHMIKEWCRSSQINFFVEYFPHRNNVLFRSSQFLCHPHTQIRITLFQGVRISIHNWKPSPNRTSSCLSCASW